MGFDVFTIGALVDELREVVLGGRIQAIIDVDAMGLGLEIYARQRRHYLYLSADPNQPRVHLTDAKLRRGLMKPTQLGLMMRRFAEGGIIEGGSQPAWERLLQIDIASAGGALRLVAELMPRRANVLLLREGRILDCLKRVGPQDNRYRLSLPNHDYVLPPPIRGQLDPSRLDFDEFRQILEMCKASTPARRALPGRILGMSPLLAKELVFRASGTLSVKVRDIDSTALYATFEAVTAPLLRREWQPGIGFDAVMPAAFSVFPLSFLQWQPADSVSSAVTGYFGSLAGADAYNEAKKPVQAVIDETKIKLAAKLDSLRRGIKDDAELESLRQSGELILAYQYSLQAGQTELRAQYEFDAPEQVIRLNPQLSALENAQGYFRRYEKAKAARQGVPKLIGEAQLELDFAEQLDADLLNARNWVEIDDVIQSLQARGHWPGQQLKRLGGGGRQGPLRVVSGDGYVVWVGRNSRQNEKLTMGIAKSQDIWLHARGVPGAHVVIRNDGRRISEDLIERAAAVAAYYSRRRGERRVRVDYTRIKYVKAIKGAGAGMVSYRNERSITVQPQDEKALQSV